MLLNSRRMTWRICHAHIIMRAERLEKKMQRANETVKKMYIIMPQAQNSREIINEKVKWSESAVEMMLQMAIFSVTQLQQLLTSWKDKPILKILSETLLQREKKKLQVRRESKCQKKESQIME